MQSCLYGQGSFLYPWSLPPDGKWALWLSKEYQVARFKEDAVNHIFPKAEYELEDCVGWIALDFEEM